MTRSQRDGAINGRKLGKYYKKFSQLASSSRVAGGVILCDFMGSNQFLTVMIFFLSLAIPQSSFGQELKGKTNGCVQLAENSAKPLESQISICYKWLKPFRPEQKTFFFLIGGPGSSADYYLKFRDFWLSTTLGRNFNLLFFDPRGVGTSSEINASNVASRDLSLYTLTNMTNDVESLRKSLLGNQEIGVIGHSTGAHQVFDYAIRFPDHVFDVISLHGGASGLGFLTQTYYRLSELQKALVGIDSDQVVRLRQLVQSGDACDQDGSKLPSSAWQQLVNFALYGTVPQRNELPGIFNSLLSGNINSKSFCGSASAKLRNKLFPQIPSKDPLNAMAKINLIINQNVVCSNFITKNGVAELPAPFHDPAYNNVWVPQCLPILNAHKIVENQFDVRASLAKIKAPILVLGADSDQWIEADAQDEIWENLTTTQARTNRFVRLQQCGHFSFYECPEQLKAALDSYLK